MLLDRAPEYRIEFPATVAIVNMRQGMTNAVLAAVNPIAGHTRADDGPVQLAFSPPRFGRLVRFSAHAVMTGTTEVRKRLTDYRDSMQLVLDQSIRLINMGKTPDELAETVKLPKALQTEIFRIEYYGNVDASACKVYGGLISW